MKMKAHLFRRVSIRIEREGKKGTDESMKRSRSNHLVAFIENKARGEKST
jgi:hypothetical protein